MLLLHYLVYVVDYVILCSEAEDRYNWHEVLGFGCSRLFDMMVLLGGSGPSET